MNALLPSCPHPCALVGMVHLAPLPGSPCWSLPMSQILEAARTDALALIEGGCDALLVENMGDTPYLRGRVAPETVAAVAIALHELRALTPLPIGVQILAGAARETLSVAAVTGASFMRVEAFAYAHVADEGWMDACAGELLRARRSLGASVAIWADIKKKHASHAVTSDLGLGEVAKGTAFCGADALIVTGTATGAPTDRADLLDARVAGLPLVVGSGVTTSDAASLAELAQALIVGSSLKRDGDWRAPVESARVAAVREAMRS